MTGNGELLYTLYASVHVHFGVHPNDKMSKMTNHHDPNDSYSNIQYANMQCAKMQYIGTMGHSD